MTSHPNLDLITRFFDAYGRRDLEGLRRVLAADARWTFLGRHSLSGVRQGFDAVLDFFDQMGAVMGPAGPRAEQLVLGVNAEYVIECQHVWTARGDGHDLDHHLCVLWRFAGGQIVEGRHFFADPAAVDDFFNAAAA